MRNSDLAYLEQDRKGPEPVNDVTVAQGGSLCLLQECRVLAEVVIVMRTPELTGSSGVRGHPANRVVLVISHDAMRCTV